MRAGGNRPMPGLSRPHRILLLTLLLSVAAPAAAEEVKIDGWFSGANAGFQAGFVAGEIASVRLVPTGPCPCPVQKVTLLFGGAAVSRSVTLRIYADGAGATPGAEIFSQVYVLTGSDMALNEIDLSGEGVVVNGAFRVGVEFSASGVPSIARDDDGTIDSSENYIFAMGIGWVQSNLLGLTGDWILRATVGPSTFSVGGTVNGLAGTLVLQQSGGDDLVINADGPFTFATELDDTDPYDVTIVSSPAGQICTVSNGTGTIAAADVTDVTVACTSGELINDDWNSGDAAAFQAGFVAGEIAAARFDPIDPCPCTLSNVRVLFGGAAGSRTVTLRVWDDPLGNDDPGAELYSADFLLTANDGVLATLDLSGEGVVVSGPFRVGIEFSAPGLPSVAADTDGTITADRNFIFAQGPGWVQSQVLGLTGDWIMRAGLQSSVGGSVWEDQNGDGLRGAGEPPLVFLAVYLMDEFGSLIDVTFTDLIGDYSFDVAANFAVKLQFPAPAGYLLTTPDQGADDMLDSDPNQLTGETELITPPFSSDDATRWSAGFIQLGPCFVPDEPVYLYNVRLSTDGNSYPILDFVDFNQPDQVTGYNIYRSDNAGLDPVLWPRVADDIVDGFQSVPDLQWVDTSGDVPGGGVWFYDIAPFNNGCGAEGPR